MLVNQTMIILRVGPSVCVTLYKIVTRATLNHICLCLGGLFVSDV